MSKNKKQHYLSAFYLYNFTNEEQRKKGRGSRGTEIFHYDFKKKKLHKRPIENIATESYLFSYENEDGSYNHELDEELKKVEDKAAISLRELDETYQHLIRNRSHKIEIKNEILSNIIELISWQIKRHPDVVNELEGDCENYLVDNGFTGFNAKKMALDAVKEIGSLGWLNILEELHKKNKYIIFTTSEEAHFITTDEPFVRFNKNDKNGIVVPETEMYFPLTSNMFLLLHGNGSEKRLLNHDDKKKLTELNTYMAKHAKNYLFGRSDVDLSRIVRNL